MDQVPLHESAPDWFQTAVNRPARSVRCDFLEADVHYRLYESAPESAPDLLLVHGGGAHCRWWDFIAGQLDTSFRIASIDLPGMGDSGYLRSYGAAAHADSLAAVVEHAGLGQGGRPLIICGHSYGGIVTLSALRRHPDLATVVVIADSPIVPVGRGYRPQATPVRRVRLHPRLEDILARFRLEPAQECHNAYILDYVARHSVKLDEVDGEKGWRWKFDPNRYAGRQTDLYWEPNTKSWFDNLKCKIALIYGEKSMLMQPDVVKYQRKEAARIQATIDVVPETHHHLFLEKPQEFAQILKRRCMEMIGNA